MKVTIIKNSIWDTLIAGAVKYWTKEGSNDIHGFNFSCPCGCGRIGSVRFARLNSGSGWSWNNNHAVPSVMPSINLQIDDGTGQLVSHWHGWLSNGEWIQ